MLATCSECRATAKLPDNWAKPDYPCPACGVKAPVGPYVPVAYRTPHPLPCVPDPPEWDAIRQGIRERERGEPGPPAAAKCRWPLGRVLLLALGAVALGAASYLGVR